MSIVDVANSVTCKQLKLYSLMAFNSRKRLNERDAMNYLVAELNNRPEYREEPLFFTRDDDRYFIMVVGGERIMTCFLNTTGHISVNFTEDCTAGMLRRVNDILSTEIESIYLMDCITAIRTLS